MTTRTRIQVSALTVAAICLVGAWPAVAQTTDNQHADHQQNQQAEKGDVQSQLHALQKQVAKLEAALEQQHSAKSGGEKMSMGMKDEMGMKKGLGMDKMSDMKMGKMPGMKMDGDKKGMAGMSGSGMGMMGKNKGMKMGMGKMGMGKMGMGKMGMGKMSMGKMSMGKMSKGMMMMGKIKSMGDMEMPSSLPGFPGASHIYHIGADSFFLDHAEHITLTTQQQAALNKTKEEAMLKQADFDRKIESAEQEVWVLTSSDGPDAKQIEDKISEVAKLQADQRIAYIRAIGEAAQTLTEEQRSSLTGATNNEEAEK